MIRGARSAVVNSAQLLTQQLNQLSANVQSLRGNAELGIADAVNQANGAMSQIAALNQQIAGSTPGDAATAALDGSTRLRRRPAFEVDGYQRRRRATAARSISLQIPASSSSARKRHNLTF